ncbi:hypothetical protein ACQ4PT_039273 [Festuca glaucescens]
MAYRVLEVTLLSAKDLKNVNLIMRMEVYAVATISGDPITRQCTPPDPPRRPQPDLERHAPVLSPRPPRTQPRAEILAGVGDHGGDDLSGPTLPQFASYQIRKVHRTETCGEALPDVPSRP